MLIGELLTINELGKFQTCRYIVETLMISNVYIEAMNKIYLLAGEAVQGFTIELFLYIKRLSTMWKDAYYAGIIKEVHTQLKR